MRKKNLESRHALPKKTQNKGTAPETVIEDWVPSHEPRSTLTTFGQCCGSAARCRHEAFEWLRHFEAHLPFTATGGSSIAYRRGLEQLGLGQFFTA